MPSDLVKAEVQAVRNLRRAITRYHEQVSEAAAAARKDVAAAGAKAREALERRRAELRRAEQSLQTAQAALARCQENCGALVGAVATCQQQVGTAKLRLGRARKAAQITSEATSNLAKMLQSLESTVGEHSSVAASALASLDGKLSDLPHLDLGHTLKGIAVGTVALVESATAIPNLATLAGNAGEAFGADLPTHNSSLSEMRADTAASEREYYADSQIEQQKRRSSGEDQESVR